MGMGLTGTTNNNYLTDLINEGNDAFGNLYEVIFSPPTGADNSVEKTLNSFKLRCTNFTIPSRGIETKAIPYQSTDTYIKVPGSQLDRKLQLTVRLDSNYDVLRSLDKLIVNSTNGFIDETKMNKPTRFTITVCSLKVNSNNNGYDKEKFWVFYDCEIVNMNSISFGYKSSDSLEIPIDIIYSSYNFFN